MSSPSPQKLAQLRPTNLREQARAAIRAQIVMGGIETGAIYPVGHFSSQFGVSATPVREALFDLVHEGLVEPVRNRGFRIIELSERDLDEILEVRVMLEVPAMRKVAGKLAPDDLAACRVYAEETARSAADGDLQAFLTADRALHLRVLAPLRNRPLVEIVGRLRDQARLPGLKPLAAAGTLAAAAEEHHQILDALEAGDAEEAETRMRLHLQHVRGIWAGRAETAAATSTDGGAAVTAANERT